MEPDNFFSYVKRRYEKERKMLFLSAGATILSTCINCAAIFTLVRPYRMRSRILADEFQLARDNFQLARDEYEVFVILGVSILLVFISVVFRDYICKRSASAQSIISDGIQNLLRDKEYDSTYENKFDKYELELILKDYIRSLENLLDLPLIPGKFGPVIYLVLNFLLTIFAIYFFF